MYGYGCKWGEYDRFLVFQIAEVHTFDLLRGPRMLEASFLPSELRPLRL